MIQNRKINPIRALAALSAALTLGAAGIWASDGAAQTRTAAGPFTDAQAQAGQAVYNGRCASCHDA